MEQLFITNLAIKKVRHLKDISIPLSENQIKHLIFTGKNGSGKTSVVESMACYLNNAFTDEHFKLKEELLLSAEKQRDKAIQNREDEAEILKLEKYVYEREAKLEQSRKGLEIKFNIEAGHIFTLKDKYHYILAYYRADRIFQAEQPKHVEKVQFKDNYKIEEFPRNEFVKYLLDLKMTEALARNSKKTEK